MTERADARQWFCGAPHRAGVSSLTFLKVGSAARNGLRLQNCRDTGSPQRRSFVVLANTAFWDLDHSAYNFGDEFNFRALIVTMMCLGSCIEYFAAFGLYPSVG